MAPINGNASASGQHDWPKMHLLVQVSELTARVVLHYDAIASHPFDEKDVRMNARGAPGVRLTWTTSAKDRIGTGLGQSKFWFTLGHPTINEVYYPRIDSPQTRRWRTDTDKLSQHVTAGVRPAPGRLPLHKVVPRCIVAFIAFFGLRSIGLVPLIELKPMAVAPIPDDDCHRCAGPWH